MTISEESEKRDEGEMHDEMKDIVEIHLKTEDNITNSIGHQETKLTVNKVERMGEATIKSTTDKCIETTKFGTTYFNGQEVLTSIDSCSSLTVINHGITIKTVNSDVIKTERETNSINKDEAMYEHENDDGQDYKMLLEDPLQTDVDTIMKTDMNYADNHVPKKHRAVTNHLHFPFGDDGTSQCDSHMKNGDNNRQVMKEVEKFNGKVGYGCRTSAWYVVYNNHLQLPASELQTEYYTGNKYDIDQSMIEDIVQIRDDDGEQFADDPTKGARTFNNSWLYSGSNILFREQIYRDHQDGYGNENIPDEPHIDDVVTSEGKEINTPVDPQGSEIMWATTGDFHGTISAQHTSCRFIDTEKILTESGYTFADMIKENEEILLYHE